MRFQLDGLEVFFPYDRIYMEQYQYMKSLKQSLDRNATSGTSGGGHCLLEMPTGTGKTVCLLSLITSYQYAHPDRVGKLVYATRTVPEMNHVMDELATVYQYRAQELLSQQQGEGTIEAPEGATSGSPDKPPSPKRPKVYKGRPLKSKGPIRMWKSSTTATNDIEGSSSITANGGAGGTGQLALCLSSRRNMCIHPRVMAESDREAVDEACRKMTASWVLEKAQKQQQDKGNSRIETCPYYNALMGAGKDGGSLTLPSGVYDLQELQTWGQSQGYCPYFLTRRAINHANVIVFNYQYLLDPKVAKLVSKEIEADAIVVFDEAHNIDSVCIEALSVTLNQRSLDHSTRNLTRLTSEVQRTKAQDATRLQNEYNNLISGLIDQGLLQGAGTGNNNANESNNDDENLDGNASNAAGALNDIGLTSNVLDPDVLNEAVPGNIRRAEHFIGFMKKVVEHLKKRLSNVAGPNGGVRSETPLAFLHRMTNGTSLEAKPLRFAYSRLQSLLRTLQVSNLDDYSALSDVADFASLLATYSEGMAKFAIIMEPNGSNIPGATDPVIQLACLDASLAIAPLFKRFRNVIITSGTLSPIDLYPKLLQFQPCVSESFAMSTFRPCIRPLVISRGSDQLAVSTRYEDRGDMGVVRNYGAMLVELCSVIPDGVVAFFTSYSYMEALISEWDAIGILRELTKSKLVFIETKDVVETTLALDNYRLACDCGRGAVFLSVARGKVSEGINFDRHYGRAVIMFGVPYQYTLSHVLRARLEYLQSNLQIREQDFLNFDAIRQVAQCVGRVIRSKTDYGLMIFADSRYNRHDKRSKLPKWILQFLSDADLNLSTDMAVSHVKSFLRLMGQPIDHEALQSVLLTLEEVNQMNPSPLAAGQVPGEGGAMITESTAS